MKGNPLPNLLSQTWWRYCISFHIQDVVVVPRKSISSLCTFDMSFVLGTPPLWHWRINVVFDFAILVLQITVKLYLSLFLFNYKSVHRHPELPVTFIITSQASDNRTNFGRGAGNRLRNWMYVGPVCLWPHHINADQRPGGALVITFWLRMNSNEGCGSACKTCNEDCRIVG